MPGWALSDPKTGCYRQGMWTFAHLSMLDQNRLRDTCTSAAKQHPDLSRWWYLALHCSLCTVLLRSLLIEPLKHVLFCAVKCTNNSAFWKKTEHCCYCLGRGSLELGLTVGGAGVTCCLHQIAVDGPYLAITAFSHRVVVACGANSTWHQCKRGGIIYSSVLFLHVREKKAQNDQTEQLQGPNAVVGSFTCLSQMGVSFTALQFRDWLCAAIAAVSCQINSCLPKEM